jgi:L-alanine-DL-glutamate epimerase-like enolase superfamily enzyme
MLESSISVAAAAHVASACGISVLDLDGPELCQFDPAAALSNTVTQFSGPTIRLNQTPGLGIDSVQGLQLWPWQA